MEGETAGVLARVLGRWNLPKRGQVQEGWAGRDRCFLMPSGQGSVAEAQPGDNSWGAVSIDTENREAGQGQPRNLGEERSEHRPRGRDKLDQPGEWGSWESPSAGGHGQCDTH